MASVTSNELCKECQILVSDISCEPGPGSLQHHRTMESLNKSSKNACGICIELLRSLRDAFASETADALEIFFPINCIFDTSSASWQSSFEMTFNLHGHPDFSLRFVLEVVEESECKQIEYAPSSSTNSPQSWDLIGRWLNQCTQKHGGCNTVNPEPWTPTRLLDIGTSESCLIRLLDREETVLLPKQSYATLSHCWGKSAFIKTTSNTIRSYKHGIPYHNLPLTFRDAIKVARNVRIRYIWIDSLCIVQDDIEDWAKEANLMSKVYRNSFINIAATGSDSSAGGCFWERDERTVLPSEVYIQWHNSWRDRNEETTKIRYRVALDADTWTRKLTDEPLNRRSWTLQERILSPRVLHFGREQLFWECREFFACETYHRGLPAALQSHPLINIKRLQLGNGTRDNRWPTSYISKIPKEVSYARRLWYNFTAMFRPIVIHETTLYAAMNSTSVYLDWYAVVELYSMGNLTFIKDKLVALSGIAQTIIIDESQKLGDGYLAGLWQSSLPASLLWRPANIKIAQRINCHGYAGVSSRYMHQDAGQYTAPTWSWASIDGQISFASCQVNYKSENYLATLEAASVSYNGNHRFGQITSGFVKLSGPVASALWEIKDEYPPPLHGASGLMVISHLFPPHLTRHKSVKIDTSNPSFEEIFLDMVMEDIPEELTLLCIIGYQGRNVGIHVTEGLVLQRSIESDDFVRIGTFVVYHNQKRRVLMNMPRRSITIV